METDRLPSEINRRAQITMGLAAYTSRSVHTKVYDRHSTQLPTLVIDNPMTLKGPEISEDQMFFFEVLDEAMEIMAGAPKQMKNFSIGYCSALSVCNG